MEEAQRTYSHEAESKVLNIIFGNEETEYNGHRSKVETVELVETVRILRVEVWIYRDDNEIIIRV